MQQLHRFRPPSIQKVQAKSLHRPNWFHLDATGQVPGRIATSVVRVLIGKHKPSYRPAVDNGDYVVITNANKIALSGNKWNAKVYRWHTMWPGGLKEQSIKKVMKEHPERVLQRAVSRMLPKNKLRKVRLDRLKVYTGPEHPHLAQLMNSYHPPHIQLGTSWTPKELDPDKYTGYYMDFKNTDQGFEVIASPSKGVRTFNSISRIRRAPPTKEEKRALWRIFRSDEFWQKDPYNIGKEPPVAKRPVKPWKPMEEEFKEMMSLYEKEMKEYTKLE